MKGWNITIGPELHGQRVRSDILPPLCRWRIAARGKSTGCHARAARHHDANFEGKGASTLAHQPMRDIRP
jgi:hypothetical protein